MQIGSHRLLSRNVRALLLRSIPNIFSLITIIKRSTTCNFSYICTIFFTNVTILCFLLISTFKIATMTLKMAVMVVVVGVGRCGADITVVPQCTCVVTAMEIITAAKQSVLRTYCDFKKSTKINMKTIKYMLVPNFLLEGEQFSPLIKIMVYVKCSDPIGYRKKFFCFVDKNNPYIFHFCIFFYELH